MIDDFFRFTWVLFLSYKDESFDVFNFFCKRFRKEKKYEIIPVRSDHGGEFENSLFKKLFEEKGISHNFSCPRAPQHDGVVERQKKKNLPTDG